MRPLSDRFGDDLPPVTVLSPSAALPSVDVARSVSSDSGAGTTLPAETWQLTRRASDDGKWLHITLAGADDHSSGDAWERFSPALETALAIATQQHTAAVPPCDATPAVEAMLQVANGLVETARLDARCRRRAMPLHLWLGGAIRSEIPIALPVRFDGGDNGAARRQNVEQQCLRIRAVADAHGVCAFSVHDASENPRDIAAGITAVRTAVGPDARLVLRLARQLSVNDTHSLMAMLRGYDLLAVVDPCDSVSSNARATAASLPALGLSASAYDRATLLDCLATTPPAVLFVDPIREGGLLAARRLAAIANVLHVDLAVTAAAAGPWLAAHCVSLAAVLPAVTQPVEWPFSWNLGWLDAVELRDGMMMLDAIPRLSRLQGTLEQV